jgi:acetylglutamate kinase
MHKGQANRVPKPYVLRFTFYVPMTNLPNRLVIKLGGEIILNRAGLDALAREMALLVSDGTSLVVVHGGGPQADALAARLGHRVRKVAGRRVTDDDALEVAKMVYGGSINLELLAALRRHGARPVGISGVDGGTIIGRRRSPTLIKDPTGVEQVVDFGHVGDIAEVDTTLIDLLTERGYVPVVASLAADREGNLYNVNADTIAQALAVALQADRLVLVTNVSGIMRDPADSSTLIRRCDVWQLRDLITSGVISGGMLPKAQNCIEAIEAGVRAVQIIDGTGDRSLLLESIADTATGTLITAT